MIWTVGQVVVVSGPNVPDGGYPRRTVVRVSANGGCTLDDGSRWTKSGVRYGDSDRWSFRSAQLRPAELIAKREAEELAERRVNRARDDIRRAADMTADIAVLERALAVLRGET